MIARIRDVDTSACFTGHADTAHDLRSVLRSGTHHHHQQSESLVLTDADPSTLEGYQRFLTAQLGTYQNFAVHLDDASKLTSLPMRSATLQNALWHDLHLINPQHVPSIIQAPELKAHNQHGREALAWGVGYVLEGSAAGATVLKKTVSRAQPDAPITFITMLCEDHQKRWPRFKDCLSNLCLIEQYQTMSVRAARQVFTFLIRSIHAQVRL